MSFHTGTLLSLTLPTNQFRVITVAAAGAVFFLVTELYDAIQVLSLKM